ncbi:MAG: hypothetical protein WBD20_28390 [Pirellulaceae bacterium]
MSRLFQFAVCLLLMINLVRAQDPANNVDFELKITDDAGRPLPDAQATITSLFLDNGWSIQWDAKPTRSDERGTLRLNCPASLVVDGETANVQRVAGRVQRGGFAMNVFRVTIAEHQSTLMLKKEATLGITAVDSNGQRIDEFGLLLSGQNRIRWIEDGDAISRCVGIKPGQWQAIVVHPKTDGKHLFSMPQTLRFKQRSDINLRNLRLRPGLTLRGKLSVNVTRPIKDGFAVVYCQPKPVAETKPSDLVTWCDSVPIQADGTFEFSSLPRTGLMQLVASCEGGVLNNAGDDESGIAGVTFDLDSSQEPENDLKEVEVEMSLPVTVKVVAKDADENPVANVIVAYYLQQRMLNGRSYSGSGYPQSLSQLVMNPATNKRPVIPQLTRYNVSRKTIRTNQNGVAELTGLPLGGKVLLFWTKENDGKSNTRMHVVTDPDEMIEITIVK